MHPSARSLIRDDQVLRAKNAGGWEPGLTPHLEEVALTRSRLGLLYYRFKPEFPHWIVVVTCRKMIMALITLLFHSSATFQLAMLLLVLFSCFVIQMKYLPYVSPLDYDGILSDYKDRATALHEEEQLCEKTKDQKNRQKRRKQRRLGATLATVDLRTQAGRKELRSAAAQLMFEYNTVELTLLSAAVPSFLLSAAILICVMGIMLDSDYVDNGKHTYARSALVTASLVVIGTSLLYFAGVVWHEIVVAIFPSLACFGGSGDDQKISDELDFSDVQFYENPDFLTTQTEKDDDEPQLLTVQEQIAMKKLLAQVQEENRILKHRQTTVLPDRVAPDHVKKRKDVVDDEPAYHRLSPRSLATTLFHRSASIGIKEIEEDDGLAL